MDVVALEHAAFHIGGVIVAGAQALERGVLVAECGEERERKLRRVEGLDGQVRYGLFDFYCVHEDILHMGRCFGGELGTGPTRLSEYGYARKAPFGR